MKAQAFKKFFSPLIFLFFLFPNLSFSKTDDVSDFILKRCQYLERFRNVPVCSTCVSSQTTIPDFYRDRDYRPAWDDEKKISELFSAINSSYDHGLNPGDYHLDVLKRLKKRIEKGERSPEILADYDVLLTDALLRLSFHLFYGKVSPESLDPDWNFKRTLLKKEPYIFLKEVIDSGKITKALNNLVPKSPYYRVLKRELKRYREFEKKGWPKVPAGKTLKLGMRDERIIVLKRRLHLEGFYNIKDDFNVTDSFDEGLFDAVKTFQVHNGLEPDGVVGKNTIRALNITPKRKVDQIRVNLERARWILHDLPERFLIVNIAGFKLYYLEHDKREWSCKVMVGKPYWKTPVFKATMKYVVLNPYWVVPPGILRKEVIPKIKKDPQYLKKNNMEIVDLKGRRVDPQKINWARVNPRRFPYIIRQKPGPKNALGRIKFIFPNKHFVFLHDTPAKALFAKNMRTFSHGCIRVEKPIELVKILFEGSKKWTFEKIKEIIDSKKNKVIHLERKIPVLVLYWTVTRNKDNSITFLPDIYNRDYKILLGLDTPMELSFLGKKLWNG